MACLILMHHLTCQTWELNLVLTPIKLFAVLLQPHCFTSDLLSCQLTAVHKCLCLSVSVCVCFIFHVRYTQSPSWPATEPWPLHVQRHRTSFICSLFVCGQTSIGGLRFFPSVTSLSCQLWNTSFHFFLPSFSLFLCLNFMPFLRAYKPTGFLFCRLVRSSSSLTMCHLVIYSMCLCFWRGLLEEPYPFLDKWNSSAHSKS